MRKDEYRKAYDALKKFYPLTLDDLDDEEWRDVVGYEGHYQVSNFGRVKSFWRHQVGKIITPQLNHKGYLVVELRDGQSRKVKFVHRLVAQAFIPNPDGKPEVNHRDGGKFNNHVDNLEWVTRIENMNHAVQSGFVATGEDNYQAQFTNEQAYCIRVNPDNLTIDELAKKFNCNPRKISQIQLGQTYKNAGGEPRSQLDRRKLANEIREQIRAEFKYGDTQFGACGLARKYGVCHATILNIIKEGR